MKKNNNRINNIVFCVDNSQFIYALFNIKNINDQSAFKNSFYLVAEKLNEVNKNIYENIKNVLDIEINLIEINNSIVEGLNASKDQKHVNNSTFFRLFLSSILPKTIDEFLYLDTDTFVIGEINKLFDDCWGKNKNFGRAERFDQNDFVIKNLNKLSDKKIIKYFNAGVMFFNSKLILKNNSDKQILNFLYKNKNELILADQDVLNACLVFDSFNPSYNIGSSEWEKNNEINFDNEPLLIFHYFSDVKPWNDEQYNIDYMSRNEIFSMTLSDYKIKQEFTKVWREKYSKFKLLID